jgi:bidirectional [NiFe] hydrogenase diaphorase subunit
MGRGINSIVITDLHQDWGSSACTRCGKCVQVCPTGALFDKSKSAPTTPSIPIFCPT